MPYCLVFVRKNTVEQKTTLRNKNTEVKFDVLGSISNHIVKMRCLHRFLRRVTFGYPAGDILAASHIKQDIDITK